MTADELSECHKQWALSAPASPTIPSCPHVYFSLTLRITTTTRHIYIKQSQHQKPYENRGLVEIGV